MLALIVLSAALVLPRPARAAAPAWEPASWAPAFAELKRHLKALIRIDTSNPPGDELPAARYLEAALAREGIGSEVFVSTGARASLVARLKGSGRRRALLLVCHTDVVPAERDRWTVDPFGAEEKDGYIYGRGAADIKGMCAAELMTLVLLKREKAPLDRDVVFFAQADEEVGGSDRHLTWLLREHGGALDAEFAVNEGGHTIWQDGAIAAVNLQTAEKQYLDVRLVARGSSGHASVPRPDNPVEAVARAVARVSRWEPPFERNPLVVDYVRASARPEQGERRRLAAKLTGSGWEAAARRLARLDPETGALFRDTVVGTMLRAGYKANVVPSEAEATLNCRLMPGRDPKAFARQLAAAIREPGVEVLFDADELPPIPPMPLDTPLYEAVRASLAELQPRARLTPFLSAWSTDAQALRARGTVVYGLDPPLSAEDADRAHGHDERIRVDALEAYLRLLHRMAVRLAVAP